MFETCANLTLTWNRIPQSQIIQMCKKLFWKIFLKFFSQKFAFAQKVGFPKSSHI